ncbi:MAG: BREX system Lon protease-like protein BrxL [Candidatus Aminicenantes bacterium]|nr:BREX system Lon protease-like protein BrxL [Candidatus Aminicenantes bacterium]NIM84196.1 BREX system Lon protease-like protein BrxL [Candidatus Aminicenantes bacterium]NIN23644.1 BREX system Lon protease-like protein BrxL [Candidatus Aminicenantes bacterium]NIN47351.1 BREX system Lon protease-like protein BrxL [Candidatus Aminicenantes bacterium]NIN90280.1 BREX system Lon protease-like protein BrxL [Candidatus Aminicenantes bacterium]
MDTLDQKLNEYYPGKGVRKDLLHHIKEGTNVPSFVLEFLLARYCASEDPDEIEAGKEAVTEVIEKHYVRPDESNKAQSTVQQKGRYKFIDKLHVRYVEKEKRHWAEMENFNSRRIAVPEKFYRDNDRLLEGGIWAEVTVGHNDIEEDNYAFYIEDMRPIQLGRFDYEQFIAGREPFTRDEWLDIIIRSIGLEPSRMDLRLKFHHISRLFSLVESNYNFIELGPRGTGKSYTFSEFSPYSTLISGGQASTATLFYNNARRKVGLIGFWDTVAFDEVAGIKIKDQASIQIMKDYMANGRFSRGVEVNAPASLAFVGNFDYSVEQVVNSPNYDLFQPLPKTLDLAVMDRFHCYLPGWEMTKTITASLTNNYGFITDYMAEAFHYIFKHINRYDYVRKNCQLGSAVEGRDERSILKTVSSFLKILHPCGDPSKEELYQYLEYALEGRRRVKEQMNKRKPDDEFARINLSYFNDKGEEIIIYCPESRNAKATQYPRRKILDSLEYEEETAANKKISGEIRGKDQPVIEIKSEGDKEDLPLVTELKEKHIKISYGDTGFGFKSLFGDYLDGINKISVEDPYIRSPHQVQNFLRLCELAVSVGTIKEIHLLTSYDHEEEKRDIEEKLNSIVSSILNYGITLCFKFSKNLHDREIRLDNKWIIKIGRGLDFYQAPEDWYSLGATDMDLRPCLETRVDIFRVESKKR